MTNAELFELAQAHPREFVRGIEMGRFAAMLHIKFPVSRRPIDDALEDAMTAVGIIIPNDASVEEVDAYVRGAGEGVEVAFARAGVMA